MRTAAFIAGLVFISLFSGGCGKNDAEEQRLTWSTDAPMSIPFRTRLQRHQRINLIRNYSFETGKIYKVDSLNTSFAIEGWQQTGDDVEWTDIRNDSLYHKDEALSGYRSVKITRKHADETDSQGEGILSDFIKVIPGNYSLSLYARLENVMPLKARLGTRIYDAVDISIQFYDRNKIAMDPAYSYPMTGQMINTSFKGLSFANYKTIPSFGWGKIIGKSAHFPFPEGDIPSDAHFVRIFIGLKGTGTLWIDSVNFRYTEKNFSVAERMQALTDTFFHTSGMFTPTPKKVTLMESVQFYRKDMTRGKSPVILIPRGDAEALNAARLLRNSFTSNMQKYGVADSASLVRIAYEDINTDSSVLIFSIGKTNAYNNYAGVIPVKEISGHRDGYIIYTPSDNSRLVILSANTGEGLIYAALTASQMIDSEVPVFHNNRIIDYPDFESRYCILDPSVASGNSFGTFINDLVSYKISGGFIMGDSSTPNLAPAGFLANFTTIHLEGYFPPADSTLTYSYPVRYKSDGSENTSGYIIPPAFHNEMLDNSDYSEVCCRVPVSGKPLYSGTSFFSMNTDAADILRFSSIMGKNPVFMDNSMLMSTAWGKFNGARGIYPGKIRLFNLFEPYLNQSVIDFFPMLDTSVFVINLPPNSEINIIRLATAADFMWNYRTYSADLSLWKVLRSRYGADNARDLIAYADKYALLLELVMKTEMKLQVPRNLKAGQQAMIELTSILSGISVRLGPQHKLVRELQDLNADLRMRLNRHRTSPSAQGN